MGRIIKKLQDGFIKYHGCGLYHRDGTNVLVTKWRGCAKPINACFWMRPEHVQKKVTTHRRELTQTIHNKKLIKQYQREQLKACVLAYYSTNDETMSVSDSDSDSDNDSDNNRLIIDIENVVKAISKPVSKSISKLTDNQTLKS